MSSTADSSSVSLPSAPATDAVPAPAAAHAPVPIAPARRRPLVVVTAVFAVVGLAVLGYSVLTAGRETTDDAFVEADIVSVQAEVTGRVEHVLVHSDQPVTAGDVLFSLGARELDARAAAARADLAIAEAEVRAAEAQAQIAEASATGGLDAARAQVEGSAIGVRSAAAQIDTAKTTQSEFMSFAKGLDNDLSSVDVGAITAQLSTYQAQLTASYTAISKVQSLNLASYLRYRCLMQAASAGAACITIRRWSSDRGSGRNSCLQA